MPRAGLTPERIISAAATVADEVGLDRLTLAAVAQRCGVSLPGLYKHVSGLDEVRRGIALLAVRELTGAGARAAAPVDRKSTRLNSSHGYISYAVLCLKKKLAAKDLGAKEWNNSLKTKLSLLPKKRFRIRMSRNFGMKMLTMTNLSTECLIQRPKLGYDATPFNQILKQNAKREMRLRLGKVTVVFFLAAHPLRNLLFSPTRASPK